MAQAVVLAGGASRRLGRPKALVDFLDGTVLSTIVERLEAHGVETVVVVHPDLVEATADLPCRVVVNPRPDDGRTGSLHLGLAELGDQATGVLICPVDRPGWDESVLEALLNTPGDAVVPAHEGRAGHPLLVRGEALVQIMALAKDAPLRDALPSRTLVEVNAPYLHLNLDQPQDLEALPALQAWLRRGENP
ncbi:MAG TPA: hypothetical protein D7I05_02985 [Candidatus Poseidoniales archaeon]|nr:MAG TPA: hypothetical protein D7I05_02985 [Candidatus Poseidoniales archaeon]